MEAMDERADRGGTPQNLALKCGLGVGFIIE